MPYSDRRYALLRGWARYLCLFLDDITREVDRIVKQRGTSWGIAVEGDLHALRGQRLTFRRRRAAYAVGMFGLSGHASLTGVDGDGKLKWKRATADELAVMNAESMARDRSKASVARKVLREAGLAEWCKECGGVGYLVYGDQDYPCSCMPQGVVAVKDVR